MKKLFFAFVPFLFLTDTFGQKTEYSLSFNSGLFSFAGESAEKTSQINYSSNCWIPETGGYTNNPYGSKSGLSYGLSINAKRITKKRVVLGLGLGYETLRSRISITEIGEHNMGDSFHLSAKGRTNLNYGFINLNPQIGYRFSKNNILFDLTAGFDAAYCLYTRERGKATAENGEKYKSSRNRKTISTDIRPRIELSARLGQNGISVGYSYGLSNYKSGYIGGVNQCYARLLRFGFTRQIK